jgi:hypothetical protein
VILDHATLEALRSHHPAWRLLRSDHVALVASFLNRVFVAPNLVGRFHQPIDLHFVNADLIASGLSPLKPQLAAVAAGRLVLAEMRPASFLKKSRANVVLPAPFGPAMTMQSGRCREFGLAFAIRPLSIARHLDSPHAAPSPGATSAAVIQPKPSRSCSERRPLRMRLSRNSS